MCMQQLKILPALKGEASETSDQTEIDLRAFAAFQGKWKGNQGHRRL